MPIAVILIFPNTTLFFALSGPRRNGNQFIEELYNRGVKNFVVNNKLDVAHFKDANIILVKDSLTAFQQLAIFHRSQFDIPVVGITGSNGKTIVKEWLNQLLEDEYNIVRSPRSYNSQIGVPLSVWQMNESHGWKYFEAGISQPGEMKKLEKIIQPAIGIFTNIGEAHSEGFKNIQNKIEEKIETQAVKAAWSQVDIVLQRRADLIPNLVETVKGYAQQEQTVFGDIAKARSALLSAGTPQQKIAANGQLDGAIGRLLLVVPTIRN